MTDRQAESGAGLALAILACSIEGDTEGVLHLAQQVQPDVAAWACYGLSLVIAEAVGQLPLAAKDQLSADVTDRLVTSLMGVQ